MDGSNVAIATYYTDGVDALANVTNPTASLYAQRHGYRTEFKRVAPYRRGCAQCMPGGRVHPAIELGCELEVCDNVSFERFGHVLDLLERGYEYVLHRDVDTFMPTCGMGITVEERAQGLYTEWATARRAPEPPSMVFVEDLNGINSGVAIFRNTPTTKRFLHVCLEQYKTFYNHHKWREQKAVHDLKALEQYGPFICVAPDQRWLQSYRNDLYPDGARRDTGGFDPSVSWWVHLPGLPDHVRIAEARKMTA